MNIVAIVGRPNVGKSTLFNRIIQRRHAIVEEMSGVTRDRLYDIADWAGKHFTIIDTGGIVPKSDDVFERAIREQAMIAVEEADSIIFVCDGTVGITPMDTEIATILRKSQKHVTLAVNKCDNEKVDAMAHEFYSLGLGDPFTFSALSGRSTGDLLDNVIIPFYDKPEPAEDLRLKIAIVGRPNAGKSSLVNALLGKDRMIVTPIAGTTRDAIDSVLKYHGEEILLIDTAGLRKRSHIKENVEMYSILRTQRAIERCDVAVIMIDAERNLEMQDKRIISDIAEARKGVIIAINKWDLIEKDSNTANKFAANIKEELRTIDYAEVEFISALTKQRVSNIIETAKKIHARRNTRISTAKLNEELLPVLEKTPPPSHGGRDLRINYITQVGISPPVFAFFSNHPEHIAEAYKRFMEHKLREIYDFKGTPISFLFKRKNIKRVYE